MSPKSFYDLAFEVSPGAARKDVHYVRGSLDEVKEDLAAELSESSNVYLLCWYGSAELALHVYQQGERGRSIDLRPLVTVSVDGYPAVTFLESGEPTGYGVGADDPGKVRQALEDGMFSGELDDAIKVTVDWDSIEVPGLIGEVATDDDYVKLAGDPDGVSFEDDGWEDSEEDDLDEDELEDELIERGYIPYGFTDFEA
ncbi:hypothetical protein OOK13_23320 [Streptomyces sp. NBC_00378]|uniref:hypothetical protein n=1 Tax=unclassified Streptomyces TaxID=2593676 RepID=UPI002252EF9B|nr:MULTISPECIES: hypothetical protein [unclassified Streptomyces]MCX5111422.1 hypothetical protein [Streptomyces sp. NBC_00378]